MESMDDSTPLGQQLAAQQQAATAGAAAAGAGGAASAAPAALPTVATVGLLQPSSFSAAMASHPFMSQHNARSPHGTKPVFGGAAAPAFSLAPPSSSSGPPSSASFVRASPLSPSTGGGSAKKPAVKRSSAQYGESHLADAPETLSVQSEKTKRERGVDSDDDVELGFVKGVLSSPDEMDEEGISASASGKKAASAKNAKAAFAAQDDDGEDSSFMNLLSKLANLGGLGADTIEQCPCCPLKFPIAEFAEHVYKCIQKLEPDERKEQERLDAKLATEIAFGSGDYDRASGASRGGFGMGGGMGGGMNNGRRRGLMPYGGRVTPEAVEEEEEELLNKFASNTQKHCKAGSSCTRVDAQHFVLKWHPEVECPLCSELFPVYEVNAHVTICLDNPKPKAAKPEASNAMSDSNAAKSPPPAAAAASSSSAAASSSSAFPAGAFSSAAIAIPSLASSSAASSSALPRRSRKLTQRSASASNMGGSGSQDEMAGSPPTGLDDENADDEGSDDEQPAPLRGLSASPDAPASSTSLQRSNSDCSLSLAQAAAVASMVIKRKMEAPKGVAGEKDPSLLDLLSTFSSLGFTRENLEALHAKHSGESVPSRKDNDS